jgi:hypothetical protein
MVEMAMPRASTGTVVPRRVLHSRGVKRMAPRVVAVVMITDIATLPCVMRQRAKETIQNYKRIGVKRSRKSRFRGK